MFSFSSRRSADAQSDPRADLRSDPRMPAPPGAAPRPEAGRAADARALLGALRQRGEVSSGRLRDLARDLVREIESRPPPRPPLGDIGPPGPVVPADAAPTPPNLQAAPIRTTVGTGRPPAATRSVGPSAQDRDEGSEDRSPMVRRPDTGPDARPGPPPADGTPARLFSRADPFAAARAPAVAAPLARAVLDRHVADEVAASDLRAEHPAVIARYVMALSPRAQAASMRSLPPALARASLRALRRQQAVPEPGAI